MKRTMASQLLLALASVAAAGAPSISAEDEIPSWATDSTMQLSLSSAGGEVVPLDYPILPSTQNLGLNQSDVVLDAIKVEGIMIAANSESYDQITGQGQIAYLPCDDSEDENSVTPNIMLLELMENKPKAIILYSTVGNWCRLTGSELPYQSIFSMADAGDSTQALEILNGTNEFDVIQVTITGNVTAEGANGDDGDDGSGSTVAMIILYTITGIISLLFLTIICTGAVRAHRYPERYGPRAGSGGRSRQSRAKGLARAVLETIPIVKFGNPDPPKPDPNLELESASIDHSDRPVELNPTIATQQQQQQQQQGQAQSHAPTKTEAERDSNPKGAATAKVTPINAEGQPSTGEENLGCSICTEDFTVGQDVRVLPCSHKFHPNCVDPWLVNVSGTCPLCRLDLRPKKDKDNNGGGEGASSDDNTALPPPLELDGQDADAEGSITVVQQRRKSSRLFDINRLRHASAEERIQALRQYQTEQRAEDDVSPNTAETEVEAPTTSTNNDDATAARGRRARLADRLRERFRIRTGPQVVTSGDPRLQVSPVDPQL